MDPRYLRFMVHWILLSRSVGFDMNEDSANRIIASYVDLLTEANKQDLVALYSSKLPYDMQVQKMAVLLQSKWRTSSMQLPSFCRSLR